MAETTVLGLFEDIDHAASALTKLKDDAGRASADLMVLSSVPFPEGVLESDKSPVRLPLLTLIFAFAGIAAGILVAFGSASDYVIRTGGKPILPIPAYGIIAYEFMMLLALSGAFGTALYEMRLPSWRAKVYDPRISEGLIGIAAHCTSDTSAVEAEKIMRDAGAADLKRDARSFE